MWVDTSLFGSVMFIFGSIIFAEFRNADCVRAMLQKKKHHQLRTVLCRQCRLLSHGKMITVVGGHGGYLGGKLFATAEELREKLSHLRHEKALIVKLVNQPLQHFLFK